jgi:hypothetical protein
MLKTAKFVLFILLITLPLICFATPSFSTPSFMESLAKDGIGIRQLGMGATATSIADDMTAVFYNPAGLGNQFFGFANGYEDLSQNQNKANDYAFVSFRGLGYGSWKKENLSGERGDIIAYSWAKESTGSGTNWGLTYKLLNGNLPNGQTSGYGIDLGLLGTGVGGSKWGILFSDIVKNTGLPTAIRAGASTKNNLFGMLLACDVEMRNIKAINGPNVYFHVGAEKDVAEGLVIRCGYNVDRFTGGASLMFPPMAFDYALMTSPNEQTESIQLFGIRYGI